MNLNIHPPVSLRIVLLVLIVMVVSACGQKGDLYLPAEQNAIAHQLQTG